MKKRLAILLFLISIPLTSCGFVEYVKTSSFDQSELDSLSKKRNEYIYLLESTFIETDYEENEKVVLISSLVEARAEIIECNNVDELSSLYKKHKAILEDIKTKEQLAQERFQNKKLESIEKIKGYVNLSDYREKEATLIKDILESFISKINLADNMDSIDELIREYMIEVYQFETDKDLYDKELIILKEESYNYLSKYLDINNYSYNKAVINNKILAFEQELEQLDFKEQVTSLLERYKSVLDDIETDDEINNQGKSLLIISFIDELRAIVNYYSLDYEEKYFDSILVLFNSLATKEEVERTFVEERIKMIEPLAIYGEEEAINECKLLLVDSLNYYLDKSMYPTAQQEEIDVILVNSHDAIVNSTSYIDAKNEYVLAKSKLDDVLEMDAAWEQYYLDVETYINTLTLGDKLLKEVDPYNCHSWLDVGKVFDYYAYYQVNNPNYPYKYIRVKLLFDYDFEDFAFNTYCNSELYVTNFDIDYYLDIKGYIVIKLEPRSEFNYENLERIPPGVAEYNKTVYFDTIDERVLTRGNDFDDFPFYQADRYPLYVENSEQLWYALENGYIPVCKEGSMGEYVLNECKRVLRDIVKDDMTQYEKIFVISNYLNNLVNYDSPLDYSNNVEGILFNGGGICSSYARAMVILLCLEGIECKIDSAYNDKNHMNNGDHLFNYVYSPEDDVWYVLETHQDLYRYEMSYRGLMNEFVGNTVRYDSLTFADSICDDFYNHLKWDDGKPVLIDSSFDLNILVDYYESHDHFQLPIEYYADEVDLLDFVKDNSMDYLIRPQNILNRMNLCEIIILKNNT